MLRCVLFFAWWFTVSVSSMVRGMVKYVLSFTWWMFAMVDAMVSGLVRWGVDGAVAVPGCVGFAFMCVILLKWLVTGMVRRVWVSCWLWWNPCVKPAVRVADTRSMLRPHWGRRASRRGTGRGPGPVTPPPIMQVFVEFTLSDGKRFVTLNARASELVGALQLRFLDAVGVPDSARLTFWSAISLRRAGVPLESHLTLLASGVHDEQTLVLTASVKGGMDAPGLDEEQLDPDYLDTVSTRAPESNCVCPSFAR